MSSNSEAHFQEKKNKERETEGNTIVNTNSFSDFRQHFLGKPHAENMNDKLKPMKEENEWYWDNSGAQKDD